MSISKILAVALSISVGVNIYLLWRPRTDLVLAVAPAITKPAIGQLDFSFPQASTNPNTSKELKQALRDMRAVPYFRDGAVVGMRLFAIKAGSIYEEASLKDGDIITRVNGESVGSGTRVFDMIQPLIKREPLQIEIERSGKIVTLSIPQGGANTGEQAIDATSGHVTP